MLWFINGSHLLNQLSVRHLKKEMNIPFHHHNHDSCHDTVSDYQECRNWDTLVLIVIERTGINLYY